MILKAILCVQHFSSFDAMIFIVNLLIKTDSTVICVPCMLEHVCYEPLSLKNFRFGRYLMLRLMTTRIFFLDVLRDQKSQHFNEDLLAVNTSAFSFVLYF